MSRTSCERNISYDDVRAVYYLYMDSGRDSEGRRLRRYQTYPSLSAARKAKKDFFLQRELEERSLAVAPNNLTLEQWLEEWMREIVIPSRAWTTVYGYDILINKYVNPRLGDIPLQSLAPKDLQHYYTYLSQECGLGGNTVRHHHALLSAALHAAMRQDLVAQCVTDRVEPPRFTQKAAFYYNAETLKKLYRLVEGHWLETPVHLAGSLGLRREEICGLRWESVDLEQRRICIKAARTAAGRQIVEKETKNPSSVRVLYMEDDIYRLLLRDRTVHRSISIAQRGSWNQHDLVALDKKGSPLSPNDLTRGFTAFIRANDLPPLTFHGLRHTFATVASSQGVPLFDIGKALGHSTPSTTGRIYTHLTDQFHADTMTKVANALK